MSGLTLSIRLATCSFLVAVTGCRSESSTHETPILRVAVAASLADVMAEIAREFEKSHDIKIIQTHGSSGQLCRQIENGAPFDVFIPAATEYVEQIRRAELAHAMPQTLARNSLVIIVPRVGQAKWKTLENLLQPAVRHVALANPEHAPAGRYAKQALMHANLWDKIQPVLRYAEDVRFAARYVAEGAAQAGIVYATDARAFAADVSPVYQFSNDAHDPIEYAAVVLTRCIDAERASAFLAHAGGRASDVIWKKHGFLAHD